MSSETPDPRRWIALILLCATQFMLIIDVSIVNVALPTIEVDLDFTNSSLQWVASAYALTFGGFLLLGGRCADLLGRRRMFMAGLAVFTIASLACGFAIIQQLPDRRARGSGPRRRDDRARGALDPLHDLRRGQRAQQGAGRVGRGLRRRRSGGRAAGRRAHGVRRLGMGLLRQRADRPRGHPARAAPAQREPRGGRRPLLRPDRRGARHGQPLAARLHGRQDRPVPLVLGPYARLLRRLGRADGRCS